jgi:MoaA/NifB/PqqE/SkfB family radical SAM enzyme
VYKQRIGPSGLHFFDRTTGSNILFDEVAADESVWSIAPQNLSIALTNACDLECAYCYAPKHAARLDSSAVLRWCQEADENGCFGVGFGGGEPTLYPGFVKLVQEISTSTSLAVSFTTHGHHLTEQMIGQLEGHANMVRVSMDGTGPVYERLRGRSFNDLLSKVRLLSKRLRFGINVVVNSDTLNELTPLATIAIQEGASQLLLLPETRSMQCTLTQSQAKALEKWISDNSVKYPLAISSLASTRLDIPRLAIHDRGDDDREFLHVDANSTLKRCSFDCVGVEITQYSNLTAAIRALRATPSIRVYPSGDCA